VRRALATASFGICAILVAGCGSSSLQSIARKQAKYYGDPRATIMRTETVQLRGALPGHRRWAMIQMRSRRAFRVGCLSSPREYQPRHLATGCHPRYLEVGIDLANHDPGLYWGLTASEVSAIVSARQASPRFRIFPDTPGLYLRCAIPRGGPANGIVTGTCSTVTERSGHVRQVDFIETWRHGKSKAIWIVTLSRNGRVQSIRGTGHAPQLIP
jgi:hypothetical protein